MWERVHRRITQPVGWLLLTGGVSVWAVLLLIEWFRAGALTLPWIATTVQGICDSSRALCGACFPTASAESR